MIEQTLQQLTRDDVLRTLKEAGEALPEGERYACLFQGRQYDVKAVIVRALAHTKGLQLPAQKVEDALHKPFVEALESLEFTVVKIPRNLGDTQLPVMIYEIKKPPTVQANYKRLFSANQKRFYWNRDKFAKLKAGDPVFIVNASDGQVLFGYMQDTHIKSDFDAARGISQFTHQSETFEVNGQYDAFVCIDIRKTQHTPGWSWKSLGSEEHTYIAGSDVSTDSAASNLQRVNLLMEVFADDEEILLQLHTCYHVVREKLPPAAESNAGLEPRVWYVMQGKRFNPDIGLKYLWAPQSGKGGRQHAHWLAVKDVRPGDIIVHHAEAAIKAISKVISLPQVTPQPKEFNDNWHGEGYQVEVQPLMVFEQPIDSTTIRKRQQQLQWALEAVRGEGHHIWDSEGRLVARSRQLARILVSGDR